MKAKSLKLLRTQKGLTQLQLAVLSGMTVATVSRAESGESVSKRTVEAFARVLKVSVDKIKGE